VCCVLFMCREKPGCQCHWGLSQVEPSVDLPSTPARSSTLNAHGLPILTPSRVTRSQATPLRLPAMGPPSTPLRRNDLSHRLASIPETPESIRPLARPSAPRTPAQKRPASDDLRRTNKHPRTTSSTARVTGVGPIDSPSQCRVTSTHSPKRQSTTHQKRTPTNVRVDIWLFMRGVDDEGVYKDMSRCLVPHTPAPKRPVSRFVGCVLCE
jgi:hypothetical protein